jgi:regulator of sigma E protease
LACGVKVLRFSIGFGPTALRYVSPRSGTEYALSILPLGGYVRMLDEREGEVAAGERHLAFNTQPLRKRALIVAAGPAANLILAVVLYGLVNWIGTEQAAPVLSTPSLQSLASQAGFEGGERVLAAGFDPGALEAVQSFEEVRWWITRAVLEQQDLVLEVQPNSKHGRATLVLPTSTIAHRDFGPASFAQVGITAPQSKAIIGDMVPGEVAQQSGLQSGDLVLAVNGEPVKDSASLRATIRRSGQSGSAHPQQWRLERQGQPVELTVTPRTVTEDGATIGRIGAGIGGPVQRVHVHYGVAESFSRGAARVWEVGALSLRVMGRVVVGEASLKNISGPVSIADYAGKSASAGLEHYLLFLALISVSLGVLNLLPIPVLDGGHLMYYLWEWLTGSPPNERWMDGLQRAGVAMLAVMMGIAMWNDLSRLLS